MKRGRECHSCGEEYNVEIYNIEAVGKNIKWGKGEGNFREESLDLKYGGWGRISSCMELYTLLAPGLRLVDLRCWFLKV